MNLEHIIFRMDLNAVFELHLPNKKEYLLIFLTFSAGLEGLPYDWPQWSQRIYLVVVGIREQINLRRWTAFPFPRGLILNHNLKCARFLSIFKIEISEIYMLDTVFKDLQAFLGDREEFSQWDFFKPLSAIHSTCPLSPPHTSI